MIFRPDIQGRVNILGKEKKNCPVIFEPLKISEHETTHIIQKLKRNFFSWHNFSRKEEQNLPSLESFEHSGFFALLFLGGGERPFGSKPSGSTKI